MPHSFSPRQIANHLEPERKFRLDQWTDKGSIEKTLGWIDDLEVARAAYTKACEIYPDRIFILRRKAQILAEHPQRESRS